jgi:hypothetical protein
MANFLVGCDVGTSGTKAVVIAVEGRVPGSHYIEYPLITLALTAGALCKTDRQPPTRSCSARPLNEYKEIKWQPLMSL